MKPEMLSQELRTESGGFLELRRGIVGLAMVASGSMGLITLYQVGIIKHLPEPPLRGLDADRVDASTEAYSRFSTPDGVLGLGNYVVTLGLAAMGERIARRSSPGFPYCLQQRWLSTSHRASDCSLIKSQNTMHSVPGACWRLARRLPPFHWSFPKHIRPLAP